MAPSLFAFVQCIALSAISHSTSTAEQYPFSSWMSTLSSALQSKTIFEIVIPGANKAGMSFPWNETALSNPSAAFSPYANDAFYSSLLTLSTLQQQREWARRQNVAIYELLMHGIRFLDLSFEFDGLSNYYAHNGLYGLSIHQVLDDIHTYVAQTTSANEVILLYFNHFTSQSASSDSARANQLQQLYEILITHEISSFIIRADQHDIGTQSISQLTSNNEHLIVFVDEFPATSSTAFDAWFFDTSDYFHITSDPNNYDKPNMSEPMSESQSLILDGLRSGWSQTRLNLIYWTPFLSATFEEKYYYASYFQFNAPFNQQFQSFVSKYPKLWFANVILSDFADASSDIVQQSIALNLKYAQCNDQYTQWGQDDTHCPARTALADTFYKTDIVSSCTSDADSETATQCVRSCGLCPTQTGYPGDSCHADSQCDASIYALFSSQSTGVCADAPTVYNQSLCLSVYPKASCVDYWELDVDQCTDSNLSALCAENACSSHYDCVDGYCNPTHSVCMSYNTSKFVSFSSAFEYPLLRYWFFTSVDAEHVLASLEPFRPGDSSAPYTSNLTCETGQSSEIMACVTENVAASPYMASVLGLMFIPFILSLLLCVCYCCIWPWWCCCENWTKRQCCHRCCKHCYDENTQRCCCETDPLKCMGTPEDSPWIHWIPCVILGIAVVVSLWATIDALVANSNIHEVLFDDADSLQYKTDDLVSTVVDRLSAAQPSVKFIVNNGLLVLGNTISIITKTYRVEEYVDEMNSALNTLRFNYVSSTDLTATVINPFSSDGSDTYQFTVPCPQCDAISDSALTTRDAFDSIVAYTLRILLETIQQFEPLYKLRNTINEHASELLDNLDGVIEMIEAKQQQIGGFFETASDLDTKYREKYLAICLSFTLILAVLPLIGMMVRWKWCFKVNWCCAMWLGSVVMFITSFAALVIVLWGDFCVRLDDFEQNQENSQLAKQFGSEKTESVMQLIDTCWEGASVLSAYGLDEILNWDSLRISFKRQLTGKSQEALYFDQLALFKTELHALSTDEFVRNVDGYIAAANALGTYCGCGAADVLFDRANLINPINQCTQTTEQQTYWQETASADGGECALRFINASYAAQAEQQLLNETETAIHNLRQDALQVFYVYDTKIFPLGTELFNDLHNLSCIVDPLFAAIDGVVYNFSNCGFVGDYYGSLKESGCVLLFNQTYYIARALTVIAFMSIVIVFFSYCMDYVYGPPALQRQQKKKKVTLGDDDEEHDAYDEDIDDEEQRFVMDDDRSDEEQHGETDTGRTAPAVELMAQPETNEGGTRGTDRNENEHELSSASSSPVVGGVDGDHEDAVNTSDELLKQQFLTQQDENAPDVAQQANGDSD